MLKLKTNWQKVLILVLTLLTGSLFYKIFELNILLIISVGLIWLILKKFGVKGLWLLPVLFLINLSLNKFFGFNLKPFYYTFDIQKIVITKPDNLALIDKYWHQDLWLPYRIRNLFYSSWMMTLTWLDLVFKLLSPIFWIRMLGYSGFFITFLGIIEYFNTKLKLNYWWWYFLTIILSSGLGILIDSKSAVILTLPIIIHLMFLSITSKNFSKYQKYWFLLLIIDLLLK